MLVLRDHTARLNHLGLVNQSLQPADFYSLVLRPRKALCSWGNLSLMLSPSDYVVTHRVRARFSWKQHSILKINSELIRQQPTHLDRIVCACFPNIFVPTFPDPPSCDWLVCYQHLVCFHLTGGAVCQQVGGAAGGSHSRWPSVTVFRQQYQYVKARRVVNG